MTLNSEDLSSLSQGVASSVSKFQSTGDENDRLQALEEARHLTRVLQAPAHLIKDVFLSPGIPMAIKIAHDMGIFACLSKATSVVTCEELAAPTGADQVLVERIMRVLNANGFAAEESSGRFMDLLPAYHKTPMFLSQTQYKNPGDHRNAPFQRAYDTKLSFFEWLGQNPPALARFNTFMEGTRAHFSHWAEWFPVQDRLIDGARCDGRTPFLVDIGGGRGHDLMGLKLRYPQLPGPLVLAEMPWVIDEIQSLDSDIQRVKHDFFTAQPVKGARAYYLKWILHDYTDENCRKILLNIVGAMERGYSKILIEENVLPEINAGYTETMLDMILMAVCPGIERTEAMWTRLFSSVGLKISKIWAPTRDTTGIMELELQD
ncbi:Winged helix-turn-helix transcription repressor DNA-binding [Penicillium griseofulvum]|uniref:Winged helix-turn-helix transcription repressor DNA-binding n=1 Tax=Penicillium patulum TaxID=5078 RepID=A0A135LCR2_PENPA|nr:Winged helix-turn-helix transcription repressor DNA-binding [Penicillium griseofulvum]KXG46747.1 Winged helix-turn-helix transcription repressor DNA-binding [Penicillium griseofulvum]